MTVKQRLIIFAKSQEKSVRAFEIKCGLTVGYINAIRISISPDKIQSIVSYYPELNIDWLLTGQGEMLKSDNYKVIGTEKNKTKEPDSDYKTLIKGDSPPPDQNTIWAALMKLVESNNILIQSNQSLVEAQTMLAKAHEILAATNAKLTNQVEEMKETGLPGPAVREKKKAG
jgi:hypothetical protein